MTREEFENTHCYMCSSIACDRTAECVEACSAYQKEVLGKEEFTLSSLLDNKLSPLNQLKIDLMRAWIAAPQHDIDMYNDTLESMAKTLMSKGYAKEKLCKWLVKTSFTDAVGVATVICECSGCGRTESVVVYDPRNVVFDTFDKHCRKCGAKMEAPK